METIIVTGGLGRSGKWIVQDLLSNDYRVVVIDLDHPGWNVSSRSNLAFREADLRDFGQVADVFQLESPDAVVHWGAIRGPERHPGSVVFSTNTDATYNVLVNAGEHGADVINASSESVYGTSFAAEPWLFDYLPVDEEHPTRPEDPYGVSKVISEELADMVVRRYDISVVSIRPSWIQYPGEYLVRENQTSPADGMPNCWSYVDIRDIVSLVAETVTTEVAGHVPVLCAAPDNYMGTPTIELVKTYFGTVPEECRLAGEESVYSTATAKERFDWEPEHSWRTAAEESAPGPDLLG